MWSKVDTPHNADVVQLLSQRTSLQCDISLPTTDSPTRLCHSALSVGHAVKPSATAVKAAPRHNDKKKRTVRRDPKKLTNTHLLSYVRVGCAKIVVLNESADTAISFRASICQRTMSQRDRSIYRHLGHPQAFTQQAWLLKL